MPDLPPRHAATATAMPAGAGLSGCARLDELLDAQALERLGALDPGGRAGLVRRVLNTYVASLDPLLAKLATARAAGDAAAARHVAHTLKSSSASIGALALAGHCAALEATLRGAAGDRLDPALDADVDALHAQGAALQAALRQALERGAA